MEFIHGIAADDLVAQNGPLELADACEIARQAARGLAYIHQHGMVHRDIKPSNFMVTLSRVDEGSGWHAQRLGDGRGPQSEPPDPSQTQGVPPGGEQAI